MLILSWTKSKLLEINDLLFYLGSGKQEVVGASIRDYLTTEFSNA